MSTTKPAAHGGPYSELSAEAAGDLRRPIAAAEVRFKVQTTNHDNTRAQVIAYIDARTVIARLNLLFPGHWRADTEPVPLDMRLTATDEHGDRHPIVIDRDGQIRRDRELAYRCRLQIAAALFEDVGAGDGPKAAYSDALKRAAVRAGIGECLYAMDSPWLAVGESDDQLRLSRGARQRPIIDRRTLRWLRDAYAKWLGEAGSAFGEPLAHAPAVTALAHDERDDTRAATATSQPAAGDGQATVAIPQIPDAPAASEGVTQMAAAAGAAGIAPRTVNRLAALLAGLGPETVMRLDTIDAKLAAEVVERIGQAADAGWDDDRLATVVERALRADGKTPAQRRKAFRDYVRREARNAAQRAA